MHRILALLFIIIGYSAVGQIGGESSFSFLSIPSFCKIKFFRWKLN